MSFQIDDLSKTEKNAKFNIDKSEVLKSYTEIVKLFQKDADLKGFRKGKVPENVIESIYSNQIKEELKARLINLNIRKLGLEKKINIVKTKNLEHEDLDKNSDFKFSLNFEFIPEIKLSKYDSLVVEKEIFSVKKKDIDDAISNLLVNFASNEEIKNRKKVNKKDILSINFSGELNGASIKDLTKEDATVEIGNGSLIPEIETQLSDMKIGEEKVLDVDYPKGFPIKEAAGNKIKCKIVVNKIFKRIIPKLTDEFLKKIGFDSKKKLRERISEDISRSYVTKSESTLRKNIGDKLISKNSFDFPSSFIEDEEKRLSNEYINRMNQQGIKIDQIDEKTKLVIAESANRNIKLALIFAEIARLEGMSVTDGEIEKVLISMANDQKVAINKIKKYYKENNLLDDVRVRITDEKVVQFLISKAKIKEIKSKDVKKVKRSP